MPNPTTTKMPRVRRDATRTAAARARAIDRRRARVVKRWTPEPELTAARRS